MEKSVKITLIIAGTILIIFGSILFLTLTELNSNKNTIVSRGYAEINVVPNLVTINFNVETKGNTSNEANEKNKEIMEILISNMINQGLKKEDIQTTNYNVYPNYVWDENLKKSIQKGYTATHRIKITLPTNDTLKIGSIIDAGISANASLSYINFELSPELQNSYKVKAIKLASQNAKQKAEAMAEGLDKSIGKIISISDTNFNYSPWRVYSGTEFTKGAETGMEIANEINPSSRKITASVNVEFEIK